MRWRPTLRGWRDDRPTLGMAHVRRAVRRGRRAAARRSPRRASRTATSCTCSRPERRIVKVRDGLLDVKRARARSTTTGSSSGGRSRRRVPVRRAPRSPPLLAGARAAVPPSTARPTTSTSSSPRSCGPSAELLGRRRCTSGASTTPSAAAWPSSPSAHRSRARRARSRSSREDPALVLRDGRGLGLPRAANVSFAARAEDARRLRGAARFARHRRRHELGQVPHRRATRGRRAGALVDRAEVTRLGEGLDAAGAPRAGADGAHGGRDRRDGRGGAAGRAPGDRRGRHRRVARRGQQRRASSSAVAGALRRPDRDHPRRGGGPARLPRREVRARRSRGVAGRRLRHRRRQHPVHVRPRRRGRGAVQRARRRGALHRAVRARRDRLDEALRGGARRDRRRARAPRRPPGAGGARRHGRRASTNLAAVKHGLATYDPDVVQGSGSTAPRSTGRSSSTARRTADERRAIVGLQPKRAEVILAGACIVRTVLAKLGCESLVVSDRGLRHGLIVERFALGPPVG